MVCHITAERMNPFFQRPHRFADTPSQGCYGSWWQEDSLVAF